MTHEFRRDPTYMRQIEEYEERILEEERQQRVQDELLSGFKKPGGQVKGRGRYDPKLKFRTTISKVKTEEW
jgi:hypothetical protein